jgi:hypothetical protein
VAAIQITTDNTVFGGLGGAGVHTECISWGKEAAEGRNVMVFTDLTIAQPLLCQDVAEAYGPDHCVLRVRPSPPTCGQRWPSPLWRRALDGEARRHIRPDHFHPDSLRYSIRRRIFAIASGDDHDDAVAGSG